MRTNEQQLAIARNFIRYIFRKTYNELDIKFRENSSFFFDFMKKAIDVGVIEEDQGTYRLTEKEQVPGYNKRARHLGKHPQSRKKHTLL